MYIAAGQGQTKFWCQLKPLVTSVIRYKFQNNLFDVWIYTFFFMILYMYINTGAGADNLLRQNFDVNRNILCLRSFIASLQNLFEVWFHTIFSWFNTCISPGAGADSPEGTKFWCKHKDLITLPICCKFQRNLFEVWFYTFLFSWFNTCIKLRGRGIQPRRDKVWCQQKLLVTSIICC